MTSQKSELQRAAGKLISEIQKSWGNELGTPSSEISERVMSAAHGLLQAKTAERMKEIIGSKTINQYLGDIWVQKHPEVKLAITRLQALLEIH